MSAVHFPYERPAMARRIAIIGTGTVGSSIAISTLHSGTADELLLHDLRADTAEGEAMDLAQGSSFYPAATVRTAAIEEMLDADAVVIAAGRNGKPGESRLALLRDNMRVARELGAQLAKARGVIVVVTNPVDVLTRVVLESSGLPAARVIGTGTMLDTARLREALGRELQLDPRSVHAHVVGEHGDSEVVLWSGVQIGGVPLHRWPQWTPSREAPIATEVRTAAYEIIKRKGATNHAIGLVTSMLLRTILRGEQRVLTVSRWQKGALGMHEVALSLPTIVGRGGAETVLEPELLEHERERLAKSAQVLRDAYASVQSVAADVLSERS